MRATRELCKKGLIEIQKRFWGKGHQTSNLYILLDNQQLEIGSEEPAEDSNPSSLLDYAKMAQEPQIEPQGKVRLFKCNPASFKVKLSPNGIKVYSYLSFRAGRDGQCKPSKKEIASDCGISVPTVTRAIKQLRSSGLISVKPQTRLDGYGNNGTSVNLYVLKDIKAEEPIEQEQNANQNKSIIISLFASLFPVLTPTLMSLVTPQRTMSRKKVTLKQRKEDDISNVAKRILLHKHKKFAGRHTCLAKADDG